MSKLVRADDVVDFFADLAGIFSDVDKALLIDAGTAPIVVPTSRYHPLVKLVGPDRRVIDFVDWPTGDAQLVDREVVQNLDDDQFCVQPDDADPMEAFALVDLFDLEPRTYIEVIVEGVLHQFVFEQGGAWLHDEVGAG
jgi:hypothetical protein